VVGISPLTDADDNDDAGADANANNNNGYGDKAGHDNNEHDKNETYDDVSQAALQWGRHRRN
jgi:hypothetical protein